jgi:type IV secretion system protein VirD4
MVESEGQGAMAQRSDTGAGRARAPHVTDLITAAEAARLFQRSDALGRMLVLWAGHDPMIIQRTSYYRDAPFSRLYSRWSD